MKKLLIIPFSVLIGIALFFIVKFYFFHPDFYPIKSGVCAWAGDTRILNSNNTISSLELMKLESLVLPGDLIINRKDYYLSNYGIPGFWTHISLFVGTNDERKNFFSQDESCKEWVKSMGVESGCFNELLHQSFKKKFSNRNHWKEKSIVESVGTGVMISTFKNGASKDGIIVFRPQLKKIQLAKAIYKSFKLIAKPYDFNFDFSSDSTIACTELIYKAFDENPLFPVMNLMGNPFTTAHEIAEYGAINNAESSKLALVYLYYENQSFQPQYSDTAFIKLNESLDASVLW